MSDESCPVRVYVTDDRDLPEDRQAELFVYQGGNGDWYIGSRAKGDKSLMSGVRICTSGGAASRNPALTRACYEIFMSLGGWDGKGKDALGLRCTCEYIQDVHKDALKTPGAFRQTDYFCLVHGQAFGARLTYDFFTIKEIKEIKEEE